MKDESWGVGSKQVALAATLELIRVPPFIAQSARCSLLKACFTAVFPGMVSAQRLSHPGGGGGGGREEGDAEGRQKQMVEKLQTVVRELLKQASVDGPGFLYLFQNDACEISRSWHFPLIVFNIFFTS